MITLSTRAQVEKKKAHSGTLAAAKKIIDREGVAGLYAGLDSALFGISVTNFVYYYCTLPLPPVRNRFHPLTIAAQGTSGPARSSSARPASRASAPSSPWPRARSPAARRCC